MAWADVGKLILTGLGTGLGAIGGPLGGLAGGALGGALGDILLGGGDGGGSTSAALPAPPTASAGGGLQLGSGGGGGGLPTLPALPPEPTGGLQGPVYGTQSLPAQASQALSTILTLLKAYPYVSDFLQRRWNFPTEAEVASPKSEALWAALAKQVPASHRDALEQFLVGFPAPVGLSKAASDVFLTLMIAESGYTPEQLCCVSGGK